MGTAKPEIEQLAEMTVQRILTPAVKARLRREIRRATQKAAAPGASADQEAGKQ